MTDKELEKLFKKNISKMRTELNFNVQFYEKLHWIFLAGFEEGLKEGQRIYQNAK